MNIKQLFLFVFCASLGFFLSVLLNTKKETVYFICKRRLNDTEV